MAEIHSEDTLLSKNKIDMKEIEHVLGINIEKINLGMTPFQIHHFVMNKKEFPTPFAQFLQSRFEIYSRANTILDLYYQYRECISKIKLAEGKIEKISNEETISKIKEAKIELQELEIEKTTFRMRSIKNQIIDKTKEAKEFYKIYEQHKHYENEDIEVIEKAEEEYWKTKSAYYPELLQRYNLTPGGFLPLPHEVGKLKEHADKMLAIMSSESFDNR